MKIELVDDAEAIARRWSVQLAKLATAVSFGWAGLAAVGLVSAVPPWAAQVAAGIVFAGITLAAYLKQPEREERHDDQK